MSPPVLSVEDVEMMRDGGSLRATYVAGDDFSYTLMFRIKIQDRLRVGYQLPFFAREIPIREATRVGHRFEGATELSWSEAKALLEKMRSFVDQKDPFHRYEHFMQMIYVANHDGSLPPSITRGLT